MYKCPLDTLGLFGGRCPWFLWQKSLFGLLIAIIFVIVILASPITISIATGIVLVIIAEINHRLRLTGGSRRGVWHSTQACVCICLDSTIIVVDFLAARTILVTCDKPGLGRLEEMVLLLQALLP